MSQIANKPNLQLPDQVRHKLHEFQRRIWIVKLIEALSAAAFGLLVSYLVVFALDRFIDTSGLLRLSILLIGSIGLALWLPWMLHKWIWKSRRLEQVARMLKVNHPRLGDYLLGIIELVNQDSLAGTSESLCKAALAQADRETATKDFKRDVPYPRHRRWLTFAAIPLAVAVAALVIVPAAGSNSLQRWLMPWKSIDRYTFAQVDQLPVELVVPISEPTQLGAALASSTRWKPSSASAWVGDFRVDSPLADNQYNFSIPPLTSETNVQLRFGDALKSVRLDPHARPELESLAAIVTLPDYLQRDKPVRREIRGGGLSLVTGSDVALEAKATRTLTSATVDGLAATIADQTILTSATRLDADRTFELEWRDGLGLTAKTPLKLQIRTAADEAPSLNCRELEQQRVIMQKDVLSFQVDASDDYGVRSIGMEWTGKPAETSAAEPAQGEKTIYAGNPEAIDVSEIAATFSPTREGIEPQTVQLRLFAEDYLPDRPRVYSPNYTIFVLSEDEHAIWMTRRLDEWFKQSLETYETEQQLYKKNLQLRNMSAGELDRPETRRQIESQAAAERAQSRRLEMLTKTGESLVTEAARNDQFGVDHLEKLAEMIQSLKEIQSDRMPSVADLLKAAAEAEAADPSAQPAGNGNPSNPSRSKPGDAKPSDSKPGDSQTGDSKPQDPSPDALPTDPQLDAADSQPGDPSDGKGDPAEGPPSVTDDPKIPGQADPQSPDQKPSDEEKQKTPKVPSISMKESSMEQPDEQQPQEPAPPSPPSSPKFSLPSVTLADNSPAGEPAACPAGGKMEDAVEAQEDLLAEFQKVAEELQLLISNLEGSTFVKRFKAMSRRELVVAKDINASTLAGFGARRADVKESTMERMKLLVKRQKAHAKTLKNIEDDLEAYSERVTDGKFKTVLAEMRDLEIIKQVDTVGDRLVSNEPGTSIAHSELLADTFDRWAEQLVGPG